MGSIKTNFTAKKKSLNVISNYVPAGNRNPQKKKKNNNKNNENKANQNDNHCSLVCLSIPLRSVPIAPAPARYAAFV